MAETARTQGELAHATTAVVLERPLELMLRDVALVAPGPADVFVRTCWSAISTGTERLLYEGRMPDFPGMGYPLVPGYESVGDVVWAGPDSGRAAGDRVFVAGAACYESVHALFGGAARDLVTAGKRVQPVRRELGSNAVVLALAATAWHTLELAEEPPDLIVGHGTLGRLLARLAVLRRGDDAPPLTVWEKVASRREGLLPYRVCAPEDDDRRDYGCIIEASGDSELLDGLIGRLRPGGQVVLAGFYGERVSFEFVPAFLRGVRLRVAAEFAPEDLAAVCAAANAGTLSLDGFVTHQAPFSAADSAYARAFSDPECLKMVLEWGESNGSERS